MITLVLFMNSKFHIIKLHQKQSQRQKKVFRLFLVALARSRMFSPQESKLQGQLVIRSNFAANFDKKIKLEQQQIYFHAVPFKHDRTFHNFRASKYVV